MTATTATLATSTASAAVSTCAMSQDGDYVYAGGSYGVSGFRVDKTTGAMTPLPGSPFSLGSSPQSLSTDDQGRVFSVMDWQNFPPIGVFTTANGVPAPVSSSPFFSGLKCAAPGLLHPAGFYAVPGCGGLAVFRVTGSGSATALASVNGSPFQGVSARVVTADGGLVVGFGNPFRLSVARVNQVTGAVSPLYLQPPGTLGGAGNLNGIAFAPASPNVFDQDRDSKADLGVFRPSTGVWWISLSGSNYATHVAYSWGARAATCRLQREIDGKEVQVSDTRDHLDQLDQ